MPVAKDYLKGLKARYAAANNSDNAQAMAAYMKNRFEFYGIKSPMRQSISKIYIQEEGIPAPEVLKSVCQLCFQPEEKREVQYFVNDLMQRAMRQLDESFLLLIEALIPRCAWWDSVDFLAPKLAAELFLKHPQMIDSYTGRWINSPNIWYQRSALIFQLSYKEKTNGRLLFEYVLKRADSKEFFVQKGAGWALRQYSKVAPEQVRQFLETNRSQLSPLTLKEGSKYV